MTSIGILIDLVLELIIKNKEFIGIWYYKKTVWVLLLLGLFGDALFRIGSFGIGSFGSITC